MTEQEARALHFIRSYIAEHGFSPSYTEIADSMELRSKSCIHRVIVQLERKGEICRLAGGHRSIRLPRDGEKFAIASERTHECQDDQDSELARLWDATMARFGL